MCKIMRKKILTSNFQDIKVPFTFNFIKKLNKCLTFCDCDKKMLRGKQENDFSRDKSPHVGRHAFLIA